MFSIERFRGKLVRGRPETFDRCVGISKLALQKYLQPSRLSLNSHSSQKLSCTIHFRIVVLFQARNSWHDDHRTAQFLTRCTSIYSNRYFYWRCILLGGRQVARSVPFPFTRIGSLQVWSICTNNFRPVSTASWVLSYLCRSQLHRSTSIFLLHCTTIEIPSDFLKEKPELFSWSCQQSRLQVLEQMK